jgi:ATP-dependent helicase/nuclease subunit A
MTSDALKTVTLTDQQKRAVTTRRASVVLSSGAGCGKTQVLTARYLSHLGEDAAEVGQLVAITFTDRAAREMRKRIRTAFNMGLAAAVGPEERERWIRRLRDLETAAISTIHAFCVTLLRQHAIAAGLDPRFEVFEDVLSSNLRDEALHAVFQDLLTAETRAGEDLRALVPIFGWRATTEAIEHLLKSPNLPAWDVWSRRDPDEIAAEWSDRVRPAVLAIYVAHMVGGASKVAQCLRLLRSTPCSGPKMRVNVQRLIDDTPRLAESADLDVSIKELHAAARVQGTEMAKAWPNADAYKAVQKALEGYRGELPKKFAQFAVPSDGAGDAVTVGQRFIRVAATCARAYQVRKRRAGVVDFYDLLTMARDLLRDRPAVRAAVRQRFRFVLIDELQDTDPVQMELVELLCGEGLTRGGLFAVGDAKQSIYRFRGADVGLFQALRQTVPADGRQELTVNYRSQPRVLHFVNALFREHLPDYEPLTAHRPQVNPGACVEVLWSRREKTPVAEGRLAESERIAERLMALIGQERLVFDKATQELRPARAADMVLLFRSMSNVGIYEAALRRAGLDYYLVGGRAFFAQQEIYDLLNLLRALENPHDAVSLVGTLRSPIGCLSDETLYHLTRHDDGPWAGLHDDVTLAALPAAERAAADRARRFLDRWREQKDRLPIAGLLNFVLADCGYDAALQFEFLGDRKLANLWKMIDLARTFDRSGLFGLADFIARLGELVQSQPREEQAATLPENADVIRLMTIHQAKGLEFPIVVLPDIAAEVGGSQRPCAQWDTDLGCVARPPAKEDALFSEMGWTLWRARDEIAEWHEDLRTLYVACTRAEDYLILSTALLESPKPTNTATTVLMERFDLGTGECRDDAIAVDERPLVRVVGPDAALEAVSGRRRDRKLPALTAADAVGVGPIEPASVEA